MSTSQGESQSQLSRSSTAGIHMRKSAEAKHLYPLLQCFESSWPATLVLCGLGLEFVQMLALIINPVAFPWGGIIRGPAIPIYFSLLPFWDQGYNVTLGFTQGSILFWILIACMIGFCSICVLLVHLIAEQLDRHGVDLGRLMLHGITGIFFLPSLHMFLGYAVCDQSATYLLAFPSQKCFGDVYTSVLFAASVVGMITLIGLKIVTTFFLYDDHPGSQHHKARPHNVVEAFMIGLQVTSAVLFHFMPPMGMSLGFAGIYALGCLTAAVLHAVYLPFYKQATNTFRCMYLTLIAFACMVMCALISDQGPAVSPLKNWSSLVVLSTAFGALVISYFVSNLRVSSQCLKDLSAAVCGEYSASTKKALFPANLPEEERIKLRENESIALGEARFARTQESLTGPQQEREEHRDDLWVCTPYLESIYLCSDVEVATRHVHLFQHLTGLRVPAVMIAMGIRIYTKGLAKFYDSPWLELQLASFMCSLAPQRNQVALNLCDRVMRNETVDVILGYRIMRRAATISASMFIRDSSHKKSFVAAQQMHKEALINMKLFWGKLLADQVDIVQLGTLAKIITDRREEGLKYFERVVNESNDTFSLVRYAQFMEQVMMDTESANNTREAVLDSLEQEQLGVARESNRTHVVTAGRQRTGTSISRSRTISSLNLNINVIFSILFGVIGGLLAFGIVIFIQRTEQAEKLQEAGMARGLAQELMLYSNLVTAADTTTLAALADTLQSKLTLFRQYHSQLTHGTYQTSFAEVRDVFTLPRGEVVSPSHDYAAMGLWELGVVLSSAVESILSTDSSDTARQYALNIVRETAIDSVGRLYNISISAYTAESTQQLQIGEYVMIGFYLLSLVILCVVYFVLILNFRKISSSKLSTLSLFTLIPKNALEKLMFEGKERIDKFDHADDKFEAMKISRGLEDDRDAMKQVLAVDDASDTQDRENSYRNLPASKNVNADVAGGAAGQADDAEDLDLHGKFASLLKNSTVGDTGKMKLVHHGQYEAPYTKDMFLAPIETVEEIRDRQRKLNELHVEEDLRTLREAGSVDSNTASSVGDNDESGSGNGSSGRETKSSALQGVLSGAIFVVFALTLVLGGLFLADITSASKLEENILRNDFAQSKAFSYFSAVERVRIAVEQFIYAPTTDKYSAILAELRNGEMDDAAIKALYQMDSQAVFDSIFSARHSQRILFQQQLVMTKIVCGAVNMACTELTSSTLGWNASLFTPPPELKLYLGDQLAYPPLTPDLLLYMNASATIRAVARVPSSQYYLWLQGQIVTNINKAVKTLQHDIATYTADSVQSLHRSASAEVAVAAVLVVVVVLTLFFHTSSSMWFVAGVGVVLLLGGAMIGVAAARSSSDTIIHDNVVRVSDVRRAHNRSTTALSYINDQSQRIVFNADPLAAMAIEMQGGEFNTEKAWADLGALLLSDQYSPLSNAFDDLRIVQYFDLISAALGCSANQVYQPPSLGLWWNFTGEVFGARLQRMFPTQQFYSDRGTDLAAAASTKVALAAKLLYGPARSAFTASSNKALTAAVESNIQLVSDETMRHVTFQSNLAAAGTAMAFAGSFIGMLMIVIRLFEMIESANVTRMGDSVQREDELFEKLTKQSQLALLLLAVLFTALFVFTVVDFGVNEKRSFDQNHASLREYYAIRSIADLQVGVNRTWINQRARVAADRMLQVSDLLYFGDHAHTTGVLGNSNLDTQLFGATAPQSQRFDCAYAATKTLLVGNLTLTKTLSLGVDLAQRRWSDVVYSVDTLTSETDRNLRIINAASAFGQILEAVRASTSTYTGMAKDAATTGLIGFLIILAVTFVIVLLLFAFIFRPMIGQLLNEEEGTKVMLKMIPAEVRESVPAIAEYLETGVVLQDMKMHEINEAAADLSTIPTITIDSQGTIVKFSRAAEDAFLWTKSETVGMNIKMLMPENVAAEHDGYLLRYRKTGVKGIINRLRKIRAKRKDGTLFPAEILVREVRTGRNTFFIGTLRNITVEIEFERAIVLSKAVSEAATVPIVVMNSKGVIQRFNAAAEEVFKCGQEIVGRKVNVLMPGAEAEMHDAYIDRYLRTGIKTVVDLRRYARAKKLTGELFPVRLNIRELKRGSDPIFIGYIEDMTKQVHLQMASMVSEAIMATSPTPLIAIDDVGNIISWSPAAAHTFGVTAQDAMGKNVKMLMTDGIAQRHDGYLQTYQKTGRKKMIGNTTLQKAKRKEEDGTITTFPVRVSVKDIVQQGKNNYFVAFIQDVSKQQQLETEYKISSSITNLSTLPLVTIDEKGIITAFSSAAEVCFGWSKPEAIGQNVQMLMPHQMREHHDEYIQRYLKTGTKTVIDITRKVQGITRDGNVFPIELMVREVKHEGSYNFVGYIRDISNDFRMAEANAYNDAISQLAVVPVVCIGLDGIIMACSESTCDRFLWSRDELVGQNISVLMPESIGSKHDSFLKKYKNRLDAYGAEKAREASTLLHKERHVTARTRDEQQFQAAVHVRDLHINGMPPMFVGYIRDITDEINQATQRTIASAIVSLSSIPLICINNVGIVALFSNAAEKDFGYTQAEVIGQNVKMLMPDDIASKHDGYLKAYAKTGVKNVIDSRRQVLAKKKNGSTFSVEITVKEVTQKDATGRDITEYIGFARDLTQQFILLQANTINDVVSQLATVPIVIINPRGQILEFNAAATREFGYSAEEALGRNIKMLMADEIAIHHDGYLQKYRTTRKKNVIDSTRRTVGRRRSGETFPCEISVREVVKEGTEGQFIGYIRDVSHEQLLVKQHKVNSAIIDLSTTPIVVIDTKGVVSIFSRAAEDVFGYSRSEVEGNNVKMLMPKEIATHHDEYLLAYEKTGKKNIIDTSRRVRAIRKKGTSFPCEISIREVHGSDGHPIFIGYLLDCTQEAVLSSAAAFSECVNSLSPVPIIAIDYKGTIVRFSTAAEEEFRVQAETIIGKNIKTLQTDDVAIVHDEYLSRYLRTGIKTILGTTRVVKCKRWDRTTFMGEITTREVKDKSDPNALPNFVGYLRNIESDLQIEEAFKEGNSMLELAPIPIISISLRGIVQDINPAGLSAFGYARHEVFGKNIKMLMPTAIAQQHDSYLQRYLETRRKTVIDTVRNVVAQRKNGAQFQVEIAVREIAVEGMENMYIGYIRDVTEDLKMAEAASLNEAVNSLSSTPLIVTDPLGTVLKFSQAAEQLFGYSVDEVLDKNIKMLMPPNIAIKHDRFLEVYKATRKKAIVDSSRVVQAKRKDGSLFPCEIGVREVLQADGRSTSVFVGYVRSLDETVLQVGQSAEINAMMMDLAVQGVMIIDRFGIVERVNDSIMTMFNIHSADAILGKNIKILMPDSIAEKHDEYLSTYYTTRIKHIIDSTRQVTGKEMVTNKLIPLEVAVRAINEKGKEVRYLGYVRRIDKELEILTVKKTSAAALDLSPFATVVIDAKGTILMFSRAAEMMFEVKQKDMVGKNVKALMPDDVAQHHDDYLATFRRTGEKHVVDATRTMTAKVPGTGRLFTITLQIRECAFSMKGLESVFVGYISLKE